MAPIGVAIIGGGIFAKEQHLPAVEKCDSLVLKAIFSRSLKSAQDTAALATKGAKPDLYSTDAGAGKSYDDLLKREDIAAVIIALPIVSQPEYIEAALGAGKHVLAEKPIAADVAVAEKLIAYYNKVSAESKVTLAIAENYRFTPAFAYAAVEAAKLGALRHFSIRVMSFMAANEDNKWYMTMWRQKPEFQGGFLLDGGVHYAAGARWFLNGPDGAATVNAYSAQVREAIKPIDSVTAILKTKSGATGVFQTSTSSTIKVAEWDMGYEKGNLIATTTKVIVKPVNGEETVKEFPATTGVKEEVAAWAKALTSGKPDPLQSPEEALADLEFLELIFRSGDENGSPQKYELQ